MDGNHTSPLKRPAADPLAKLEKGGGAVWAQRRWQGPDLVVKYARRQGGNAVLEGTIPAEALVADGAGAADAVRLSDLAVDDLRLFGWKPDPAGIIKCTWVLRSDLDRPEIARTVDQSIAVLARLHGAEPTAYRLVYRSPGDEVGEAAQAGCFVAVPSALVGAFIGGRLMDARGEELPPTEAAIFATVVGFILGFLVVAVFAPRVLALVPAIRAGAGEMATWLYFLIPGLVAFATSLLLPVIGLRDRDQLLGISVVIVVAITILPLPFMFLPIWRAYRKE